MVTAGLGSISNPEAFAVAPKAIVPKKLSKCMRITSTVSSCHSIHQQIDDMVQRNGVFYMKTAQERELEKRVLERKRELMESFKAQKEEKKKPVVVKSDPDTGVSGRGEEAISTVERKREYKDEVEGRVDETQVSSGLCSSPAPEQPSHSEPQEDTQFTRTPSFRLNAGRCYKRFLPNVTPCFSIVG